MRIRTSKTKNGRLFYVVKTYYDTKGVEHTLTVEKLGNENDIRDRTGINPDIWAKEYVAKLNEKEKEANKDVTVTFSPKSLISKKHRYQFNIGYLFLQQLYSKLNFPKLCKDITKKYKFEYDLDQILSRLLYGRILHPTSKSATYEFAKTLIEQPTFDEHQIYKALSVIGTETDTIQETVYKNSFALGKRKTGIIYYDCTNFFFEAEETEPGALRQYGKSKENRPLPIVEMGLFTDSEGIPLAVCIHPGNTNEQVTLKPLEEKMIENFNLSRFIVCTDAGLCSKNNKKFNSISDRAFIVTQSLKKLPREIREWALSPEGWCLAGEKSRKRYDITKLNSKTYYEKIFYKECPVDKGSYEERLIVTFSFKYKAYQENIREEQILRANKAMESGSIKKSTKNQNDFRRFVKKTAITTEGEIAKNAVYELDIDRIYEEAQYDGFYATTSNLDDNDPMDIINANKQRWQIEECFRIMKSDFKSRPAYVSTDLHIEAHFLTCVLSLILYRYLEKNLDYKYTCSELIKTLKEMTVREILGEGYVPCYTRTALTDDLHDAFGFRTDYNIITQAKMKEILRASKRK